MIFYFSGTGNSRLVAERLSTQLGQPLVRLGVDIPSLPSGFPSLFGLVFPIYSWGVPRPVLDFIRALPRQPKGEKSAYAVVTCGDDTGDAPRLLKGLLESRGIELVACWDVKMPNVYTLLPGFDVDPKEVEQKKLEAMPQRVDLIADKISRRQWEDDYFAGSMPGLKTRIVYPLFRRWGIDPKKWRTMPERPCISCGKCVSHCPMQNISLDQKGLPRWGEDCVSCLACFHICPVNTIQYGHLTSKKSQYQPQGI